MGVRTAVENLWQRVAGMQAVAPGVPDLAAAGPQEPAQPTRKTTALPSIMQQPRGAGPAQMPKPTAANLRRFAESTVVRRAINVVKDRIASMDWQIRVRRGYAGEFIPDADARMKALRRCLEEPNAGDSFRVLWEQVLEDLLVGGFGAVEMESTGDPNEPFRLWPVDGATIQIDPYWNGDTSKPRYAQNTSGQLNPIGGKSMVPLFDDELMYLRLNPRTHTPFGLGRLEVAFETVNQFLSANRYAGRLASNTVVQYALWLNEATPEQHDRLIRWWQDEIEGTGRVPILSCEQKPEVLRFAGGTDADLHIQWQEFLITMIANAFELPPMLLGQQKEVNRSTAGEMADQAFASAIVPVAKLLSQHITRDLFAKKLGWREFEFHFNELDSRDEMEEVQIQTELLKAGVLTVAEVRQMRGLECVAPPVPAALLEPEEQEAAQ